MSRKVLRIKIKARCKNCGEIFEINDLVKQCEVQGKDHHVPFSAKECYSSILS